MNERKPHLRCCQKFLITLLVWIYGSEPEMFLGPTSHQVSVTHLYRLFGIVVELCILTILVLIIIVENYHFQFHFTFVCII